MANESLRIAALFNRAYESDRRMAAGALRYFAREPIELRLLNPSAHDFPAAARRLARTWQPDGILTSADGCHAVREGAFSTTRRKRPLCVAIDSDIADDSWASGCVRIDDNLVARAAADLLTSRHLTNFAYVGTALPLEAMHSKARAEAFAQVLAAHGHACTIFAPNDRTPSGWISELPRLADWLAKLPKPCGIMTYCDERAVQTIEACRMTGLMLPDQVALVGVDNDTLLCESLSPALSSIEPDFDSAGAVGAKMLTALLETRRVPRRQLIKTYGIRAAVERGSTVDQRGGGRLVNAACDHLRQHLSENVSLCQLARTLHVSQRLLELHSKNILGHSLRDEMLRLRLENAKRLLRETDAPLAEIAAASGFGSATALMLVFKRRFGLTAGAYRSRHNAFFSPTVS